MKKILFAAVLSLCCISTFADEAKPSPPPPSEASIKQLLDVMEAHTLVDNMMGQIQGMMKNVDQQALQGKTPTPEQQQAIDKMQEKVMAIFKEQMSWDNLLPTYIRIYQQTFSQQEIDNMIKFYRSPTGQAMIKKMPLAMQNTMAEMQKQMGPMMQKIRQAMEESSQEIKDAAAKAPPPADAAPAPAK